jgi:tetraacyldisaccharide 4'-kinase
VISVGNLHLGGGGKTPLTDALCRHLSATPGTDRKGSPPRLCVLSRGYGRHHARRHPQLVVARGDGAGPCVDVDLAGDEPYLLALRNSGLAVVVGANRYLAGLYALQELDGVDLFLLDDGFSHVRLHRDLDLLAFPWANLYGQGRLLPSGRLREPLHAAQVADALIVTSAPPGEEESCARHLAQALRSYGVNTPTFGSSLEVQLRGSTASQAHYLLVTGVASGGAVSRSARQLGLDIVEHLEFRDHEPYAARTVKRICETAQQRGLVVLTTEKDAVKLADRLRTQSGIEAAVLDARARPSSGFLTWLDQRVAPLLSAQRALSAGRPATPLGG